MHRAECPFRVSLAPRLLPPKQWSISGADAKGEQACLRAGDLERAMRVMRDHRKMRLVLTKTTATWALKGIGKDKRVQDFAGTLHVVRKLVPGTATCDKTLEIAQR